ncbi:MAG: hypothetical protein LBD03_05840 [Methanobrevibacter sp.]|nr:hypothetical protein [Candidatus Methanovirga procula]
MAFFFDTNVCLGYIFKWDPWYTKSKELFKKDEDNYWSETVKKEVYDVFNNLLYEYVIFLDNLKHEIINHNINLFKKNDLIKLSNNVSVQKTHGKDMINKNIIINSIWDENGWFEVTKDDLSKYLNKLFINFNKIHFEGYDKCNECLILTPKNDNYEDLKNIFLINNIHFPDWQICLDAHDLASKIEDLVFVTADYSLIKSLEPLLNETNIMNILKLGHCKKFSGWHVNAD